MKLYPIDERKNTFYEKLILKTNFNPGFCPVCGKISIFIKWNNNFRESGLCGSCQSKNRQRQIALLVCNLYRKNDRFRSFCDNELTIYNLESSGSLHEALSNNKNYFSSEYLGENRKPGEIFNRIRHEDAHNLSFEDGKFDLVISSDVWEHIHTPYLAHKEIFRVLKKGARHIFTVPFYQTRFIDEKRAVRNSDGKIEHQLEPLYHLDPLNPNGVLVYYIFSIQMLCKLAEIGFSTSFYKFYSPVHGILGNNGIVFDAYKPP